MGFDPSTGKPTATVVADAVGKTGQEARAVFEAEEAAISAAAEVIAARCGRKVIDIRGEIVKVGAAARAEVKYLDVLWMRWRDRIKAVPLWPVDLAPIAADWFTRGLAAGLGLAVAARVMGWK